LGVFGVGGELVDVAEAVGVGSVAGLSLPPQPVAAATMVSSRATPPRVVRIVWFSFVVVLLVIRLPSSSR
jgi:hypothetical protein